MEHWRAHGSVQTARAGSADPGEQPYDQPGRPDLLLSFRILLGGINRELESSATTAACLDFGGPNHCSKYVSTYPLWEDSNGRTVRYGPVLSVHSTITAFLLPLNDEGVGALYTIANLNQKNPHSQIAKKYLLSTVIGIWIIMLCLLRMSAAASQPPGQCVLLSKKTTLGPLTPYLSELGFFDIL